MNIDVFKLKIKANVENSYRMGRQRMRANKIIMAVNLVQLFC